MSDVSRLEPIIISQLAPIRIQRARANKHVANMLGSIVLKVTTMAMFMSAEPHFLFTGAFTKFITQDSKNHVVAYVQGI